jgi:hypothetical protein
MCLSITSQTLFLVPKKRFHSWLVWWHIFPYIWTWLRPPPVSFTTKAPPISAPEVFAFVPQSEPATDKKCSSLIISHNRMIIAELRLKFKCMLYCVPNISINTILQQKFRVLFKWIFRFCNSVSRNIHFRTLLWKNTTFSSTFFHSLVNALLYICDCVNQVSIGVPTFVFTIYNNFYA